METKIMKGGDYIDSFVGLLCFVIHALRILSNNLMYIIYFIT